MKKTIIILTILACSAVSARGMALDDSELDLNLKARAMSTTRILLTWDLPSEFPITLNGVEYVLDTSAGHFHIDRSEDGFLYSSLAQVDGDLRFFSDITVKRDQTRFYRIRACLVAACGFSTDYFHAYATTDSFAVAQGSGHTLVLKADGTVWARGTNNKGQLGDGSYQSRENFDYVRLEDGTPLQNIIAISAGTRFSLALAHDGTVWAWGQSYNSTTLGVGGDSGSSVPFPKKVQLQDGSSLQNITAISAYDMTWLALTQDGLVWMSGNDPFVTPVITENGNELDHVVSIAKGLSHSIALKEDGTVWGWGGPSALGIGFYYPLSVGYPCQTMKKESDSTFLNNIVEIAAGASHTLALDKEGRVWATGSNYYGELGDGGCLCIQYSAVPVVNEDGTPLENIRAIAAGMSHSLAVTENDTLISWGRNNYGQLGVGELSENKIPYPTQVMAGPGGASLGDVSLVSTNMNSNTVVLTDGSLVSWGYSKSAFPQEIGFNLYVLMYDVNLDGQVTITDVIKLIYHVVGLEPLSEIEKLSADIDGDGDIDIPDVMKLIYYITGNSVE